MEKPAESHTEAHAGSIPVGERIFSIKFSKADRRYTHCLKEKKKTLWRLFQKCLNIYCPMKTKEECKENGFQLERRETDLQPTSKHSTR